MTVIGLGEAGCNIAELFENVDGYSVKLIDVDIEGDNCYAIEKCNTPEEYEAKFPDVSHFLNDCDDNVMFFVGGGGNISGCSLKLLNTIKEKNIYVFYIRPEKELLGSVSQMQDRLVFNVLQEYTRSGLFKGFVAFSNKNTEDICGDVAITSYFQTLNKIISNCILTISGSQKLKSVYDNRSNPRDIACICSFGVYDLKNDDERLFYDISGVEDKCYYFFINKNRLDNDATLFKQIKNSMKKKVVDGVKISYIIYATEREEDFCYVTAFSSQIQN